MLHHETNNDGLTKIVRSIYTFLLCDATQLCCLWTNLIYLDDLIDFN